jgi:hypothetical protein
MRPPAILRVFVLYTEKIISAEYAKFRGSIFLDLNQMSKQPEEIPEEEITDDETGDEIEEGEIVSEDELEDFGEEDMDEGLDIAGLMTSLMATPDGETVCSALVMIGQQLQTQNKILIKILSELKSA